MRTKTIFLSLFIGILFLAAGSALYAATTDLNHATQITWESVHEPFFNKYNPYGPGARAMGMAESFAAIADDASAVYYNPSGLAQMNFNEVMWTGGSLYGNGPYTGFLTCVIALGTQYFGLSYTKLYHPTGWYPDNIQIPSDYPTAGDGGINNPTGSGLFPNNPDGVWMPANVYPDWFESISDARKDFLSGIYREFINRPFQEDQVMLTYATPLTGDKSFMFGINVKYQFTDQEMVNALNAYDNPRNEPELGGEYYNAWAWALDVGFMYKLRIIEFLKDFNIGIMLRDVSGRRKYFDTGNESFLYFTSSIALSMRTTELIEREVTSFSIDWDAVNDPGVFDNERNRLKFGFEQWFLDGHFAARGGLIYFIYPGPWRFSLGVSARYWLGIDYAYVRSLPFDGYAENEDESHWISVYWMWGKTKRKLPSPEVFAAVEPISFSPRNGEVVLFKLNAASKAGIDRWALNILDKNNNLVKTYVDIGMPPSQIVWNGADNKYQLLPDGEYTFIFEATDKLGSTSSTPVQTVKLFTPVIVATDQRALEQLKALLNQIKERDMAEDAAAKQLAETDIAALKEAKKKPTPAAPPEPMAPNYSTEALPGIGGYPQQVSPGAGGAAVPQGPINVLGFPNIDSGAIRSAYIETSPEGIRSFNMDYLTANTMPKYVLKEMALMVRSISESLGISVNRVGINATYGGNNSLQLVVPTAQAQNYTRGLISAEQMMRGSSIMLNGEAIYPNF